MRGVHASALLLAIFIVAIGLALAGASGDVLWQLRGPRVLAAVAVGALLALSGLALQVLLRNPLADPYVLGTSGGAAVGAIAVLALGDVVGGGVFAAVSMGMGSAAGALLSGALLLWLARRALHAREDDASARLILTGAMLAAVFGALSTLLLTLTPDQKLRGAIFWLVGDLSGAGSVDLMGLPGAAWALLFALVFVAYYALRARTIDRLMLGTEAAWLLGEPVRRRRVELLVLACLATACAVALAGAIGFIGLVVPQALRRAGVRHTRQLAWMSALGGAALLVAADTVARTVAWPLELPVGAVMSLIGAPVFIWFLARGRA
jgi:iron complex transport system permease protein